MDLAVIWVNPVVSGINLAVLVVILAVEAWAFLHCALQRADAFPAIGTLSKPLWLAIIGGTVLLTMIFYSFGTLFTLIAVTPALVYLLDVRPAIREITNGGGRW